MADLEATVRKRNVSGEDLEVALLNYRLVRAGEEVDLPVYYAWHRDPSGTPGGDYGSDDYDPGQDGRVGYSPALWADVDTTSTVQTPSVPADTNTQE